MERLRLRAEAAAPIGRSLQITEVLDIGNGCADGFRGSSNLLCQNGLNEGHRFIDR
jgi:hypothetical protein